MRRGSESRGYPREYTRRSISVRQWLLQRDYLLFGQMTTVVNDDVDRRNFLFEMPPEISVGLIANENTDPLCYRLTGRLYINPEIRQFSPK